MSELEKRFLRETVWCEDAYSSEYRNCGVRLKVK
jgi:hypothetical protein